MGSIQKFQQAGGGGCWGHTFLKKKLEFLRVCRQINFVPINSQLADRAGGVDWSGGPLEHGQSLDTTTIFFILIEAAFKKYLLQHLYQLKALY